MWLICPTVEAVYFCRATWTTQITLNRLVKFAFTRSAFAAFWTCAERSTLVDLPVRAERGAAPCATAAHAIVTILLDVSALYLRIASVLIPIPFGVGAPDTGTDENPWSARRPGGDSRRIDLHGAEGRAGTLTQLGGSNGRHCQRVRPGRAVAMFASCAFREPACGESCKAVWGLKRPYGALILARAPHIESHGTMEIIDHAATTDDKGRVAPDAGRGGPQHADNCGSQAERLPEGQGRSALDSCFDAFSSREPVSPLRSKTL
jgi:hypothetical protein